MEATKNTLLEFTKNRVVPTIVTIYVMTAALIYLAIPVVAYTWHQAPFLGAFMEHSLVFIGAGPERSPAWDPLNLDEDPHAYQLLAIEGQKVPSTWALPGILKKYESGESVELTVQSRSGLETSLEVELQTFPAQALTKFLYIPYGVGLIFLISAIWVYLQRQASERGRSFVVFSSSVAILTGALFDLYTTHYLTYFWCFALVIVGAAAIDLALVFPQKIKRLERHTYLEWIGYIPAWGLFFYILPSLFNTSNPFAYLPRWQAAYIYSGITIATFLGVIVYRRYTSPSPVVRQQSRSILWGAILSFSPLLVWVILQIPTKGAIFNPFLFLPLGLFPLLLGYSILRHRVLRADRLVQHGILYILLTVLIVGGYTTIVSGLSILVGATLSPTNPLLVGDWSFS